MRSACRAKCAVKCFKKGSLRADCPVFPFLQPKPINLASQLLLGCVTRFGEGETSHQKRVGGRSGSNRAARITGPLLYLLSYAHLRTVRVSRLTGLEPATCRLRIGCSQGLATTLSRRDANHEAYGSTELQARYAHGNPNLPVCAPPHLGVHTNFLNYFQKSLDRHSWRSRMRGA
jgi:hypothetical protein